ncbi:MAG: type II toxin-antitoxin system Phd/YefM family antitoxin [Erysipelotrichaceae bacterium]|jgi:prevent-host-death family protein|nr:type II toxin-antitoxin system Phd/YefM family antitoxin [Erysipelotrichaceae bacterium]
MLDIRPISDLRNNFTSIEEAVLNKGPVILTKNGYGSMVVMSLKEYELLTNHIEKALDEAEKQAKSTTKRLSHEEVFGQFK